MPSIFMICSDSSSILFLSTLAPYGCMGWSIHVKALKKAKCARLQDADKRK